MKKMKMRIWCLLLSVAMLLTMLPVMAIAKDDDDKVYDEIEKIIRNTEAEVSMKDANTRSELENELDGKWLKALKKELKDELDELNISSIYIRIEDFEAAVPKHKNDKDGSTGSAIVEIWAKGKMLGFTTALIKADTWGNPNDWDDDDDDDDKYFYGADGLVVKVLWKGDAHSDRPDSLDVLLYNGTKLVRRRSISNNADPETNWRTEWEDVSGGSKWTVDIADVPAGYTYDVNKVDNDYFEITMTKTGSTVVNNNNKPVAGDKVNPSTGAF